MTSSRFPLVAAAMSASFAAGTAAADLTERRAHAFTAPLTSTVYVPADGVAFRTFDGRVIARLSYDDRGGVLALYDGNERPSTILHADSVQRAPTREARPETKTRPVDLGF